MFGQKKTFIIHLKPHELEIFAEDTGKTSSINIPASVVNNLEVIDRDALYGLIADWTKTIPYQASEIIWLLSEKVIFEQTFAEKDRERWDTMTVQFLDSVPFEEVLSHVYTPVEGRHVIATNQDLINAVKHGFSVQGYFTQAVVPAKSFNLISPLTVEQCKHVLSSMNQILRDNLIVPDQDNAQKNDEPSVALPAGTQPIKKPKSQLPLLITVFVILVAILIIVLYLNQ